MLKLISKIIFWLNGWSVTDSFKFPKKCVIIAAPHTSNWDFLIGRCYGYITGISVNYFIKSSFFAPIFGMFFRLNGGIPVFRDSNNNLVDITVKRFKSSERFILGLSPEGTRSRVKKWKTGFYHIALKARVPIVLVAMDYKYKTVGVIDSIFPTGDIDSDMRIIEEQFKDLNGKISSNYNPRIM